jgi:hypothetical protein
MLYGLYRYRESLQYHFTLQRCLTLHVREHDTVCFVDSATVNSANVLLLSLSLTARVSIPSALVRARIKKNKPTVYYINVETAMRI